MRRYQQPIATYVAPTTASIARYARSVAHRAIGIDRLVVAHPVSFIPIERAEVDLPDGRRRRGRRGRRWGLTRRAVSNPRGGIGVWKRLGAVDRLDDREYLGTAQVALQVVGIIEAVEIKQ